MNFLRLILKCVFNVFSFTKVTSNLSLIKTLGFGVSIQISGPIYGLKQQLIFLAQLPHINCSGSNGAYSDPLLFDVKKIV